MSEFGYVARWFDLQNKFTNIAYKQFKFYKRVLGTRVRVSRVLDSSKYRTVFGPAFTSNNLNDPETVEFDYVVLLNHNMMVEPKNRNANEFEFYDDLNSGVINKSIRFKEYKVNNILTYNLNHQLGYYPEVTCISTEGIRTQAAVSYPDVNNCIITFDNEFSGTLYIDPYNKTEQSLIFSNNLRKDQEIEIDLLNGIYEIIVFKGVDNTDITNKLEIHMDNKDKLRLKVPDTSLYRIYLTESEDSIYNELAVDQSGTLIHHQQGMPNFKIYDDNRQLIYPELRQDMPDLTHVEVEIFNSYEMQCLLKAKCDPIYYDYLITFRNSIVEENFFRLKLGDVLTYTRANRAFQFKIIKEETYSEADNVVIHYTVNGLHETTTDKVIR